MKFNYYAHLTEVREFFHNDIDAMVLRKARHEDRRWEKYVKYFEEDLKDCGYILEQVTPKGLNEVRYMVTYIDEDEGYPIRREICYFRRVVGIYGGCLVQINDLRDDLLDSKGKIY